MNNTFESSYVHGRDLVQEGIDLGPTFFGSVDPIQYGHWDVIEKAEGAYQQPPNIVIVRSLTKEKPLFETEKRVDLIREGFAARQHNIILGKGIEGPDSEIGHRDSLFDEILDTYTQSSQKRRNFDQKSVDVDEFVADMISYHEEVKGYTLINHMAMRNALKSWTVLRWLKENSSVIVKGTRDESDVAHTKSLVHLYRLSEETAQKFREFPQRDTRLQQVSSRKTKACVESGDWREAAQMTSEYIVEKMREQIGQLSTALT